MKTKLILIIVLLYSLVGFGQYINQNNNTNAALKKQDDRVKQQAIDNARKPNSPSSRGSNTPFVWQGSVPYLLQSKEERAADEAYRQKKIQAEKQRQQAVEDKEKERETQRIDAEFQKYSIWYNSNSSRKEEFMRQTLDQFKSQNLFTELESKISAQELFYYANINDMTNQNYKNSLAFVSKLKAATMKEPLDTLVNYVWKARLFPDFSLKYLKKLQAAYPAKKQYLEQNELLILANYFGANLTHQFDIYQYYYPKTGFELMDDNQKTDVLNRFEELETLYPEAAKKAAGRCRIGFNMFKKYAEYHHLPLKNKSSAKRSEYYIKTLETVQPIGWLPSSVWKEDTWKKVADLYLKDAAFYLQWNNRDYVKNLSVEKWLEIGNAYQINMEYVAWTLRDILSPNKFIDAYPNLTSARINEIKKRESGAEAISKDAYLIETKNEKTNGTGIYNVAIGVFFEGTLKDGNPHGQGKAYYLRNIDFDNVGDMYVGEYKNGVWQAKGTTYQTHVGDLYLGEFKNGDWNGLGKLTRINGFYKEGQFKKNQDYKVKYYNNLKTEISKEEFEKH